MRIRARSLTYKQEGPSLSKKRQAVRWLVLNMEYREDHMVKHKLAILGIAVAGLLITEPVAHAQYGVLALSCGGKVTDLRREHKQPVNIPLVVNLPERSVYGLGSSVARITRIDAAGLSFEGRADLGARGNRGPHAGEIKLLGGMDRVTGALSAATISEQMPTAVYELLCRPARHLI